MNTRAHLGPLATLLLTSQVAVALGEPGAPSTHTIRVAAAQAARRVIDFRLTPDEALAAVDRNFVDLERIVDRAGRAKCDALVLPEDTPGLLNWVGANETLAKEMLPKAVNRMLERLGPAAARHRMYLVVCSDLTESDGATYNTAFLLGRDGKEIGRYHKVCPTWSEAGCIVARALTVGEDEFKQANALLQHGQTDEAINALGEKARDHEYTVSDGKLTPSVYHPAYHAWSRTSEERSRLLGNRLFNDFRAWGLAKWVSEDGEAIRSVARDVYIAVDYNGRFDDKNCMRVGTRDVFLTELKGIDIIQIAPHPPVWGTMSWDDVIAANQKAGKHWAISEHMSGTGSWGQDDKDMTEILENTLARGTRFGWDLVNAGSRHATDDYHLYDEHWHSQTLDIIDGDNWPKWVKKIGAKPFVPQPR